MSIRVLADVWENSKAESGALLVLLALADFADDRGKCWPSIETIARKSKMTERHVRRVLRQLELSGDISSELNAGKKGTNVYWLTLGPARQKSLFTPDIMSDQTDKSGMKGGTPESITPDAHVLQTVKEPSKNRQERETAGEIPLSIPDGTNSLIELWNSQRPLCQVLKVTEARSKALNARWREAFFREHWRDAIARLSKSSFATGKNDRGWVATIDWFLRPDTVARIMEGKYDNRATTRKDFPDSQYEKPFGGTEP